MEGIVAEGDEGRRPVDFVAMLREYRERVPTWVRRQVKNRQDVEDLTSETLARIWHRRRLFDPARSSPCHWAFLNTRTVVLKHLRRRRDDTVRLDLIPEETGPSSDGPAELHASAERAREVREALRCMPGLIGPVMRARYIQGKTWPRIASTLHISVRTAQYLAQRGRELMRARLTAA